jgi:integrase
VRRNFRQILKKSRLPAIRLYDLRHTCASLLLASGEPVNAVAERLGHADPTMILKVYAHVLPGAQRALASRMERLLYG